MTDPITESNPAETGPPSARPGDSRLGVRWLAAVLVLHVLLAVAFTWPLVRELDTGVPGPRRHADARPAGDGLQYLWNVWWVHRAVLRGLNPYECPEMFHPLGARLYFDTLTVWNGVLALPFVGPTGPVRAANLVILINVVLCGMLATALGWEATRSRVGAVTTGLAFAVAPVVFGRLADGQWNFSTTAPLALGAWLLLRLANRPSTWRSVALGLGLAAAGYAEYTYLLFLLLLIGLMAAAALFGRGPAGERRWRFLRGLILAGAILCVMMSPVLIGAKREFELGGKQTIQRRGMRDYSADLAEYVIPNPAHPLVRGWTELHDWMREKRIGGEARRAAPGIAVVALGGLAFWRRRAWPGGAIAWWALVASVALVISLGNPIRVFGADTVPGVYRLFRHVPVIGYIRAPGRYSALVQLAMAVLAGFGAAELARRRARLALGVGVLVLLFEFLPTPIPLTPVAEVPLPVRALAHERDPGAVWDIGVNLREGLLYQTIHEHPTVGGYYSRIWDLDGIPLWSLERLANQATAGLEGFEVLLQDVLDAWDVRHVLVSPSAKAPLAEFLTGRPWLLRREHSDGWSLYRVLPRADASRQALEARLLARVGDTRPGVESAVFLAFRRLEPTGPPVRWNPSPTDLEAQRTWWREWGRGQGHAP